METPVVADTSAENAADGAAVTTTNAEAYNGSGAEYAAFAERLGLNAPPIDLPTGTSGRRGAHRKTTWVHHILTNLDFIIEHNNRRKLLCAAEVKYAFVALGKMKPEAGANMLGDAMGIMGLRAPHAQIKGRRYYDLSVANGTEEERQRAQVELDTLLLGKKQVVATSSTEVKG